MLQSVGLGHHQAEPLCTERDHKIATQWDTDNSGNIEYRCTDGGKTYSFYAPMFMTEVPYKLTHDPVYQISIDLLAMDDDPDNIFSIVFLYRRDTEQVTFDSFTKAGMGQKPARPKRAARTIAEALAGAAETAPLAWTKNVWKKLVQLHKDGG